MWLEVVIFLCAYLLGAVPHLALLARLSGIDMKGDYHENLWNHGGKVLGVIGVLGEFTKGVITVLIARWLGCSPSGVAFAGLAAVCGQMWPVFQRFNGEKGNSIAIAMSVALAPGPALIAVVFPIIALIFRTVPRIAARYKGGEKTIIGGTYSRCLPLGMFFCFLSLPFSSWYMEQPSATTWCFAILFLLIILRRLTAGLRKDLKTGKKINTIIFMRLLYDRSTASWRR